MKKTKDKPETLPGQVQPVVGLICIACGKQLLESQDWPWNFRAFGRVCNHCRDVGAVLVGKYARYRQSNIRIRRTQAPAQNSEPVNDSERLGVAWMLC